jgi:hypothetical protein
MPRCLREPDIIFFRRMLDIVIMATHAAQIAMTDIMRRMCDFPPRTSYRRRFVQSCQAGGSGRHDGAVDQSRWYPAPSPPKLVPAGTGRHWQRALTGLD